VFAMSTQEGLQEGPQTAGAPDATCRDVAPGDAGRPITRSRFLVWTAGVAVGVVAATLGAVTLPPLVAPAVRDQDAEWTPVGNVEVPEPGQPDLSAIGAVVASSFTRTITDAYMPPREQKTPVFVRNDGEGRFTVFDARCTHLGCPLAWSWVDREFLCACHGAVFDERGDVVEGPPPRPLDRYESKVEAGVLYVGRLEEGGS